MNGSARPTPEVSWSWAPPESPALHRAGFEPLVSLVAQSWNAPAAAPMMLPELELPASATHVVSVSLATLKPSVSSFTFIEPELATRALATPPRSPERLSTGAAPKPESKATRIKPPGDLVKLSDRLFYLLQPSLESLLESSDVHLPETPFPYQLEGIAFLYPRWSAVLADEMGLGKTMQAITALRLLVRAGEAGRVLVVCPKPLVDNWQRELARWAPELPVALVTGDQSRRRWLWKNASAPVRLANYEVVQRDRDYIGDLGLEFDLVVLDESQRIKNRASATAQAVRSIARRRSWALTGTPVENSQDDLIGIFEFVAPGTLSPQTKLRRLGQLAGDYVLRRTKDTVLTDLPPQLCRDASIELSSEQRETYRLAEERGVLRLAELGPGATIQHVFELVMRLKQICNFDPATGESSKFERLAADLEEVAASGRKALVFSQWVETLRELQKRLSGFQPLEYHGQISQRDRAAALEAFRQQRKHQVLLMSYGAGGVGLNLQCASYVFLFDRWWNPAVEDQAIGRAHRLGVREAVTITRFVTLATIEERINQVLEDKRELFATIFSHAERPQHLGLSREEIFGLFRWHAPEGPIHKAG